MKGECEVQIQKSQQGVVIVMGARSGDGTRTKDGSASGRNGSNGRKSARGRSENAKRRSNITMSRKSI